MKALTRLQLEFLGQYGEFSGSPDTINENLYVGDLSPQETVKKREHYKWRKKYYVIRDSLVKRGLISIKSRGGRRWSWRRKRYVYYPSYWELTPLGYQIHCLLRSSCLARSVLARLEANAGGEK